MDGTELVEQVETAFTVEDRERIREMHAALTELQAIVSNMLPALASNPLIGRMLGL